MTEQQIHDLKTLLEKSKLEPNTTLLDEKILTASREQLTKGPPKIAKRQPPWLSVLPLNSLGAIGLSVTLTVCALLVMSQVISVDRAPMPITANSNDPLQIILEPRVAAQPTASPAGQVIERPPVQQNRAKTKDQILAELDLPSVESILSNMEFVVETDRSQAAKSLATALTEINLMINSGDLRDARDRYDRLRRSCTVCQLPNDLEALALAEYGPTGRI